MQPKKREITKKNVSVPVLFLYFKSYLYKTLIYSVLSYIKITFTRFNRIEQLSASLQYVLPEGYYYRLHSKKSFIQHKAIKTFPKCKQ